MLFNVARHIYYNIINNKYITLLLFNNHFNLCRRLQSSPFLASRSLPRQPRCATFYSILWPALTARHVPKCPVKKLRIVISIDSYPHEDCSTDI